MIVSITVSVRRSSIKVLRCCSHAVLSWETDVDVIFSEHRRRQRICFKEIVTPQETRHPPFLIDIISLLNPRLSVQMVNALPLGYMLSCDIPYEEYMIRRESF